jgi:hypothetical protein
MKRLLSVFRVLVTVALLLLLGGAVLPLSAQADSWLPAPTGPYQVGTAFYHWVDETRDEIVTEDPDDKRELVVRIWYPADVPAGATPVTYLPHGELDAPYFDGSEIKIGLEPSLSAEELALTPTHSYLDVPLSDAETSYPVLIYAAGVPANPEYGTAQIQELVSHGYIVAAINHPYIAAWTVFPDGRIVTSRWVEMVDADPSFMDVSAEYGAQDQMFVLDQLELLNLAPPGERFGGRLDLDRVGIFGVSWGTWASALACHHDSRCKAVLLEGTHGYLPAPVSEEGLGIPIAIMNGAGESTPQGFENMTGPAYAMTMNGINGLCWGDFGLWPDISYDILTEEERGNVAALRARQVIDAYALAFFDQYLKGEESPLLDGSAPDYPEVEIESSNM